METPRDRASRSAVTGRSAPRRKHRRSVSAKVRAMITAVKKTTPFSPNAMVNARDRHVIEPFPGVPGVSAHGDGERVGARDRVRAQHLLAIADMPPNAGISQQARRQRPAAHGKQQNDEDQVGDGGSKKSKPRRWMELYRKQCRSQRCSNPRCVRTQPDMLPDSAKSMGSKSGTSTGSRETIPGSESS